MTSIHSLTCAKHKKQPTILVVKESKYICQDCAIFEPSFKHQCLLQKQSLSFEIQQIKKHCQQLMEQQKQNSKIAHQRMNSLLRAIEYQQVSLINDINNQFLDIKTKVSEFYMEQIQSIKLVNKRNGKQRLVQVQREHLLQQKIRKHYEYKNDMDCFKVQLNKDMVRINQVYERIKNQIEEKVYLKVNIVSSFEQIFKKQKKHCKVNQTKFYEQADDNLLDFSEFTIPVKYENDYMSQQHAASIQMNTFMKRNKVQRMKTAPCLQDSICSYQSISKSIETTHIIPNIHIEQLSSNQYENMQSLLSDRSISCSSIISKQQKLSSFNMKQNNVNKKGHIEISHLQQLQTKLISIQPTIKSIKFSNILITSQEFCTLLKQKISTSFIHTLEISNCPKINDKILLDLKTHKCKSLKKIEFKDCKDINWNDKKVKQIVKKLQAESLKVVY